MSERKVEFGGSDSEAELFLFEFVGFGWGDWKFEWNLHCSRVWAFSQLWKVFFSSDFRNRRWVFDWNEFDLADGRFDQGSLSDHHHLQHEASKVNWPEDFGVN